MQCSFQGHLFVTDSFTVCEIIHRAMIIVRARRFIQGLRTCTGAREQFQPDVTEANDSHWF